MDQRFLRRIEAFMKEHNMVGQGDGVVIGISGGADSVCLLSVLCALRERLGLSLYGVHVHHGIRGEAADGDEQFVKELCRQFAVPLEVYRYDVPRLAAEKGWSPEEAGRNCRYEAFRQEQEKRGASVIAVAHHRDDQAETVLMNLMRGSGLSGLAGMGPVREGLIRPLLCVGREEILQWLSKEGLSFREDETNRENCYGRNRVRHELLPWMEGWNPRASAHIVSAAERIGKAQDFLGQQAEAFLREKGQAVPDGFRADCLSLLELHPAVREEVLRRMVPGGLQDVTEYHIGMAEALLKKQTGSQVILPGGRRFYREYESLFCRTFSSGEAVFPSEEALLSSGQQPLSSGQEAVLFLPEGDGVLLQPAPFFGLEVKFSRFPRKSEEKIPENRYTKWFDCDKIKATVSIRPRRTGDYILLPDGKKKTVKAYMIDEKIPRDKREQIPLLADGSHVIWIIGRRISEGYKVTQETKRILQVEITGGNYHE